MTVVYNETKIANHQKVSIQFLDQMFLPFFHFRTRLVTMLVTMLMTMLITMLITMLMTMLVTGDRFGCSKIMSLLELPS